MRINPPPGNGRARRAAGAGEHRIRLLAATMAIVAGGAAVASGGTDAVEAWHAGPAPEVRAICHAGDSLWVGTGAGLFVIDVRDPSRVSHLAAGRDLASNSVRAIAARGDSVWVATDAGATLFRAATATMFSARSSRTRVPLRRIQHVAFGRRGEVLLSTRRDGVGVLTRGGGYSITRRDSLIDDDVFGILERTGRPRLYACAAGLCAQVDDTTMVSFQAGAGLPRGEVRQVIGDERTAYLRIPRRGIFQFDGKQATLLGEPAGVSFVDATSISLGADGALWVAGPGYVFVRRDRKWQKVDTANEVPSWRVIEADGGGAFAGSAGGVVLALNRGAAFRVALGTGLPPAAVASLRPDGAGGAWFVCGGRVFRADARARTVAAENIPVDAEAVDFSPAAGVLVASRWTISRRGDSGWTDLRPDIAEPDPAFTAVCADGGNGLWAGARSGALYRYDGEIWVRYSQAPATTVSLRDVRAFAAGDWALLGPSPVQSASGTWYRAAGWDSTSAAVDVDVSPSGEWFAATSDRLFHYDGERRVWMGTGDGRALAPPGTVFTALAFDAAGRLFIGTTDGIGCYTGGRARWWTVADGIGGERVNDLATDASSLWVGYSDDGLSVIPLEALR